MNPEFPVNRLANLCFLEDLTNVDSSSFLYPLLNLYFCIGYGKTATHNAEIDYYHLIRYACLKDHWNEVNLHNKNECIKTK